jgi:hypothetical protein
MMIGQVPQARSIVLADTRVLKGTSACKEREFRTSYCLSNNFDIMEHKIMVINRNFKTMKIDINRQQRCQTIPDYM